MSENQITYDTLKRLFEKINANGIDVYLIGGISAAIQANVDLYRKNDDLDIMVNTEDLDTLIQILTGINYRVEDRRANLTRNLVDTKENFYALDHELNADTNDNYLGIGIFTYERKDGKVFIHSYAYHEKEEKYIGHEQEMPERLFDLMYDSKEKEYHGIKVKCQTKAYTYLRKIKGNRNKDKQDAEVIENVLDEDDYKIIDEINRLEKTVVSYLIEYDKDGNAISRKRIPSFEEKLENYINSIRDRNIHMSDDEIKQMILEDNFTKKAIESDDQIKEIIEMWKNSDSTDDIAADARRIAHDYLNQTELDSMFSKKEQNIETGKHIKLT